MSGYYGEGMGKEQGKQRPWLFWALTILFLNYPDIHLWTQDGIWGPCNLPRPHVSIFPQEPPNSMW